MSTAIAPEVASETLALGRKDAPVAPAVAPAPAVSPISVTEKAAAEVRRHIADMASRNEIEPGTHLYLRVSVKGGGCSGFQNKLDLDANFDEKKDQKFEFHGIEVVIDKRSMLYLAGAVVDFHDDLNKRGFTVTNPNAKSTCGCGSSYSM
jgi:iron-sulfur cluster assembly accessory protein